MDQANYLDLSQKRLHQSGQLAYFQSIVECDHKKIDCLQFSSENSADGRFFITRDLLMDTNYVWQDVFSNKECHIKIPIVPANKEHSFWPLTHDTGLLSEIIDNDGWNIVKFSLSLMELDWDEKKMCKIHTLNFEDQQRYLIFHEITFDAIDPTLFLFQCFYDDGSGMSKIGYVQNNEILLEEDILRENLNSYSRFSFIGNTLYDLDPIPDKFSFFKREYNLGIGCNAIERVYLVVQHEKTKHYGVIWASLETRKWELLNFCTIEPISHIKFMPDGHFLWIQTTEEVTELVSDVHQLKKTFYRVPLKKPEKLSDLAWFSLIRSKSKLEGIDPYEEAQKYLPYYSEIRSPWEE